MTYWPAGPAMPWSYAPSGKTTPSSTSVTGSRSIRSATTAGRHFPVQNVAKATYRGDLGAAGQRRNGADFIEGVANVITPIAFFETVMVKSYETLVDSDTEVDVNTGMIAAGRLQALIESRASGTRIADLMVQMDHIIRAIHSSVPQEPWPEILRKIDGPSPLINRRMSSMTVTKRGRVRSRGIRGRGARLPAVGPHPHARP